GFAAFVILGIILKGTHPPSDIVGGVLAATMLLLVVSATGQKPSWRPRSQSSPTCPLDRSTSPPPPPAYWWNAQPTSSLRVAAIIFSRSDSQSEFTFSPRPCSRNTPNSPSQTGWCQSATWSRWDWSSGPPSCQ